MLVGLILKVSSTTNLAVSMIAKGIDRFTPAYNCNASSRRQIFRQRGESIVSADLGRCGHSAFHQVPDTVYFIGGQILG